MSTLTTENQETLRKIKSAYETNNVAITEKINAIIGSPNPLTGELLDKYNELGNTPIDEPELYKALSSDGAGIFAFAKGLEDKFSISAENFDTSDFASFINMCKNKIVSFTDETGAYKSTPKTENAKMPSFTDIEALGKISAEISELAIKIRNGDESLYTEFEKATDKRLKTVLKITGIKAKGLIPWEQQLLIENTSMYATNILNTMLGRSL
jgi:hypothetical protein